MHNKFPFPDKNYPIIRLPTSLQIQYIMRWLYILVDHGLFFKYKYAHSETQQTR